ncbi:class I SAM-dependent methyltransferase [Natronogracilivirga saccharolytica]|uniref:Class I SAM-dependent methyltransferase n=1 Tax=Natronogracilivirga saccharolytica TaxID=2812953 RepID=A0A8J7RLG8_9BACT|nr:class I SAM-dependent methyltransferase [Natronogracilivirga saccharolytica]MBP3191869.1 class I SAM-dependent methyltransferase [Natronogracilivirga saccharolytica]
MKPELQRRVQRYGWDKAAGYYDNSWREQLKPARDRLMETAELKAGERVLETACGSGLVTFRIAAETGPEGEVVATDISGEMVEQAKNENGSQHTRNISFMRMDAGQLELDDDQFDAALCCLGIMYMPDPLTSMQEMYRVLKPGGRAVVAIWGERKNCGWADIFPIVDNKVASDVCPMFFQQGTGNTMEYTFREAGFRDIESSRFNVNLHFTSPEHLLTAAFLGGPVALAYNKFDELTREEAHQEYLDSVAPYHNGAGYDIPGEFLVVKGYK